MATNLAPPPTQAHVLVESGPFRAVSGSFVRIETDDPTVLRITATLSAVPGLPAGGLVSLVMAGDHFQEFAAAVNTAARTHRRRMARVRAAA